MPQDEPCDGFAFHAPCVVRDLRIDTDNLSLAGRRAEQETLGRAGTRTPEKVIGDLTLGWYENFFARMEKKVTFDLRSQTNSLHGVDRVP